MNMDEKTDVNVNETINEQDNAQIQTNDGEEELTPEEYQKRAYELESRLDRLEGRGTKEERLAKIFAEQKLPVTVHAIEPKGINFI